MKEYVYGVLAVFCSQASLLEDEVKRISKNIEARIQRIEALNKKEELWSGAEVEGYFSKEIEKLYGLLNELSYLQSQVALVKNTLCKGSPGFASVIRSKNALEKLYLRYIMGNVKLPGHIAPLLYQLYSHIAKLV